MEPGSAVHDVLVARILGESSVFADANDDGQVDEDERADGPVAEAKEEAAEEDPREGEDDGD